MIYVSYRFTTGNQKQHISKMTFVLRSLRKAKELYESGLKHQTGIPNFAVEVLKQSWVEYFSGADTAIFRQLVGLSDPPEEVQDAFTKQLNYYKSTYKTQRAAEIKNKDLVPTSVIYADGYNESNLSEAWESSKHLDEDEKDFMKHKYVFSKQDTITGYEADDSRNHASVILVLGGFGYLSWSRRKPFAKHLKGKLDTNAIHGGLLLVTEEIQPTNPYKSDGTPSSVPWLLQKRKPGYTCPTAPEM